MPDSRTRRTSRVRSGQDSASRPGDTVRSVVAAMGPLGAAVVRAATFERHEVPRGVVHRHDRVPQAVTRASRRAQPPRRCASRASSSACHVRDQRVAEPARLPQPHVEAADARGVRAAPERASRGLVAAASRSASWCGAAARRRRPPRADRGSTRWCRRGAGTRRRPRTE